MRVLIACEYSGRAKKRASLYRSSTWNRGHKAGYDLALSHYPREQAWIKTLENYYYSHINDCLRNKHDCGGKNDK